jgi:tetratricopeptide (TPR) repeat protein
MGARRLKACAVALTLACAGALAADTVDVLVEQAKAHDLALEAGPALELYRRADAIEPGRIDILTGISRQYRHLMADAVARSEKLRLLDEALAYARRAVKANSRSVDAHLAMAITLAKRTPLESSRANVETSRQLKAGIDRVLQLDPGNDTAWHLLGRWHLAYAQLSGARRAVGEMLFGKLPSSTAAEAVLCFERAVRENPNRLMHHIELGLACAAAGRPDDARRALEKGLSMPGREKDDPEEKRRGREALKALR